MRRPYGYRGRGRGYYQGGGGRYHRGGYRPVWNRRHSRSPRRGRSRSRSPKEDPFLLKDPEADLAGHTDPLGLHDHPLLVLHPRIANLLSLKDEGLRKNKPKKPKGSPKKRVL